MRPCGESTGRSAAAARTVERCISCSPIITIHGAPPYGRRPPAVASGVNRVVPACTCPTALNARAYAARRTQRASTEPANQATRIPFRLPNRFDPSASRSTRFTTAEPKQQAVRFSPKLLHPRAARHHALTTEHEALGIHHIEAEQVDRSRSLLGPGSAARGARSSCPQRLRCSRDDPASLREPPSAFRSDAQSSIEPPVPARTALHDRLLPSSTAHA